MHFMDWEMFFICSECNEMKWICPECHKLVKSQLEFVTRQEKLNGNAAGKSLTEEGMEVWGCAPHTYTYRSIHRGTATHINCDNNVTNLTLIRHKWEQFYFIMQICGGHKESRDKPTVSHKICHIFGQMLQQHASIITINAFGMVSARTNSSHMGQITTTLGGDCN